jgi:hypothetical protein
LKKIIVICSLIFLSITVFLIDAKAFNRNSQEFPPFPETSKENNQLFGYFMLDLYQDEIFKAIQEHYNDSNINGYQTPWWKKNEMVSITQGNNHKDIKGYSYVLKITLLPSDNKGKLYGTDDLYFVAEPTRFHLQNVPKHLSPIKLIKYEHKKPPTKK